MHGRHRALLHFLAAPAGLLHQPLDVLVLRRTLDLALAAFIVVRALPFQSVALQVEFGDVAQFRVDHLARQQSAVTTGDVLVLVHFLTLRSGILMHGCSDQIWRVGAMVVPVFAHHIQGAEWFDDHGLFTLLTSTVLGMLWRHNRLEFQVAQSLADEVLQTALNRVRGGPEEVVRLEFLLHLLRRDLLPEFLQLVGLLVARLDFLQFLNASHLLLETEPLLFVGFRSLWIITHTCSCFLGGINGLEIAQHVVFVERGFVV